MSKEKVHAAHVNLVETLITQHLTTPRTLKDIENEIAILQHHLASVEEDIASLDEGTRVKVCPICGRKFMQLHHQPREHCYGENCRRERRQRIKRVKASTKPRPQGGGVRSRCSVCGQDPHEGRMCSEGRVHWFD